MGQVLLLLVVALTVAAVVFGVTVLVTGSDPGLADAEPDGRAVPLPGDRPLQESDVGGVRFDTALRGYRMGQVDQALRRAAYDIGYKDELIGVLQAEVDALRAGRISEADTLRRARETALVPAGGVVASDDLADSGPVVLPGGPGGGPGVPPAAGPVSTAPGSTGPAANGPDDAAALYGRPASTSRDEQAGRPTAGEAGDVGDDPPGDSRADGDLAGPTRLVGAPAADTAADDPSQPTRPVRAGGSVIEAEDGDLAGPTRRIDPGAPEKPGSTGTSGAAEPTKAAETTEKAEDGRPMEAGGAVGRPERT